MAALDGNRPPTSCRTTVPRRSASALSIRPSG